MPNKIQQQIAKFKRTATTEQKEIKESKNKNGSELVQKGKNVNTQISSYDIAERNRIQSVENTKYVKQAAKKRVAEITEITNKEIKEAVSEQARCTKIASDEKNQLITELRSIESDVQADKK